MRLTILPGHAVDRLEERKITREDVEYILANPLQTRPGHRGATVYLGRTESGRLIEAAVLVHPTQPHTFILKTAFPKEEES